MRMLRLSNFPKYIVDIKQNNLIFLNDVILLIKFSKKSRSLQKEVRFYQIYNPIFVYIDHYDTLKISI